MSKVTITLSTGSVLEKPLITAFRGNSGEYVVLDNEVNGTMGLPIILASKYENGRLNKIADPTEWGSVKEILRNIIAGNQMDYITVMDALTADADFFTQLTLPVASFESLKANYKPVGMGLEQPTIETPAAQIEQNSIPVQPNPVDSATPVIEQTPVSPMPQPIPNIQSEPVQPISPEPMPNFEPAPAATPIEQSVPTTPVAPVMPEAPVIQSEAPVVEPIPSQNEAEPDFSADKEAFLKACENMFDALVAKFNK